MTDTRLRTNEEVLAVLAAPSAVYATLDAVDHLESVQHAMLAVEALVEPANDSGPQKMLSIERNVLWSLLEVLNTRLHHDLKAARDAALQAVKEAKQC